MNILVDTERLDAIDSIEQALDAARAHTESTGRLIVEINADGQPMPDELLDNPPADNHGYTELRFVTVDPAAFMIQTLNDTRESLESTKTEQIIAAEQIQSAKLSEAIGSLGSILEGWHAVRDVIDQICQLADIELDSLQTEKGTGDQCVDALSKTLSEVRDALTSEDWSTMGDLLEYELDDHAAGWLELIGSIEKHITG